MRGEVRLSISTLKRQNGGRRAGAEEDLIDDGGLLITPPQVLGHVEAKDKLWNEMKRAKTALRRVSYAANYAIKSPADRCGSRFSRAPVFRTNDFRCVATIVANACYRQKLFRTNLQQTSE